MASENESEGSDASRHPSAVSTAGSFGDDEWESISSNPFSEDFPAEKSNGSFRSELGIFVNVERDYNGPPSVDKRGGRTTLPRGPRRQSGTSTTGSFDGDGWETIESDRLSKEGSASKRSSSSEISRGWIFKDSDGEAVEGDGYLAEEGYCEVEGTLTSNGSNSWPIFATDAEWQTPKILLMLQIIKIEAAARLVQAQVRPIHPTGS